MYTVRIIHKALPYQHFQNRIKITDVLKYVYKHFFRILEALIYIVEYESWVFT